MSGLSQDWWWLSAAVVIVIFMIVGHRESRGFETREKLRVKRDLETAYALPDDEKRAAAVAKVKPVRFTRIRSMEAQESTRLIVWFLAAIMFLLTGILAQLIGS